jgi:predicted transcriptional regulator
MPSAKIAISLPDALLRDVDKAARERGESRSGYIGRVLGAVTRVRRDREITRRLDELFTHPDLVDEQRRTARALDAVGTDGSDEGW